MTPIIEHTRRPDITFCRNGRILITARIARLLALSPGDSINIAADNGEYLLFAIPRQNTRGRHIAPCYPTKKNSRNLSATSVSLARSILRLANIAGPRAAFIAGEPIRRNGILYLPLIIHNPLSEL